MSFLWDGPIPAFCIQSNGYTPTQIIMTTVFWNLNFALNENIFTLTDQCNDSSLVTNVISFGPTSTGATGRTDFFWARGRISYVEVTIDTRILQTCGLFHNVFLHEMSHVIGMKHNKIEGSIMNFAVALDKFYNVIQYVDYKYLSVFDIAYIQMLRGATAHVFSYVPPNLSSHWHVSGTSRYVTNHTLAIPQTSDNQKDNYWILNHKRLFVKSRRKKLRPNRNSP